MNEPYRRRLRREKLLAELGQLLVGLLSLIGITALALWISDSYHLEHDLETILMIGGWALVALALATHSRPGEIERELEREESDFLSRTAQQEREALGE